MQRCDIYEGGAREDFNLQTLAEHLQEKINFTLETEPLKDLEYEELFQNVNTTIKNSYDEKMSVLEESVKHDIEKEFYLKELDSAWRDHLYEMDNMKTGIRLRAYNQKDPLVEYKKESFNLFTELVGEIKFNTIRTLHIIQFKMESAKEEATAIAEQREVEQRQQEALMQLNHTDTGNIKTDKKIARNDPCPCGSGKKYKQCCGKSGPKKGLFAS